MTHTEQRFMTAAERRELDTVPSLLEQVDMEVAALLEPPAWWGDDPFAGIPNAHDEENEPF